MFSLAPFRYNRASDLPQEGAAMQDAFAEMTGARTVPRVTWLTWLVEVMLALENSNNPYRPGEFDINGKILPGVYVCFPMFLSVLSFIEHEKVSSPASCKSQLSHGTYPLFSTFGEIFVRGACVGGCDDLLALQQDGSLQQAKRLRNGSTMN